MSDTINLEFGDEDDDYSLLLAPKVLESVNQYAKCQCSILIQVREVRVTWGKCWGYSVQLCT